VGHPKIIEKLAVEEYMKENNMNLLNPKLCQKIIPKKLYHPVLPIHIDKRVFNLCNQCYLDKTTNCNHNDDEKLLSGTWAASEVDKAI